MLQRLVYFAAKTEYMLKKILIGLLVVLVIVQFIRPERNQAAGQETNHLAAVYPMPAEVTQVWKKACNDCHSNYSNYPWYTNIQPVGLWMGNHIDEGKEHFNISEFGNYSPKKQAHKMEEVAEMIEEGEMPLNSYTWMHQDAKLTKEEKEVLVTWAKSLQKQIEQRL
jgi:hypothetical protein